MASEIGARDPIDLGTGVGFLGRAEIDKHWGEIFDGDENGDPVTVPTQKEKDKNPASIDLKLGANFFVSSENRPGRLTDEHPYLSIPRGEFALLMTLERLRVPTNVLGFITMRSQFKMQGLINVSGFHVDPGFRVDLLRFDGEIA